MVPSRWQPVLDEARPLARNFAAAGHRLYLVGGVVRDLLADRDVEVVDLDFTTDAPPARIKAILSGWAEHLWAQGERFGTIGASRGDRRVEITTHRAEVYVAGSRKPTVEFSTSIEADLSRRDFTVNAMALEVTGDEGSIIDPFGGRDDLAARRLRTPLDPETSFTDDPLRMLRAARFIAGHALVPVPEVIEASTVLAGRIGIVSAERIHEELHKLLSVEDPTPGFVHLHRTTLLELVLPEFAAFAEADRAARLATVCSLGTDEGSGDLVLRWAALFIGLPATVVRQRLGALRHSNRATGAILGLVTMVPEVAGVDGWTDEAVRRLAHRAGPHLSGLRRLARAWVGAGEGPSGASARLDELDGRLAELGRTEDLAHQRPPLDGAGVAAALGVEPGPVVGRALTHLLDLQFRDGPLDPAAARAALDRWWAGQGPPEA